MRYERKYRIEGLKAEQIAAVLHRHPAGFAPLHPDRCINNIYFDTPSLDMYRENVMGIAVRNKYRVRWYGTERSRAQRPQLEIKHRHNELGGKHVVKLPDFELHELPELQARVNRLASPQGHLIPVLFNCYHRSYFGSRDRRFRITIDSNLRYHPLLFDPDPSRILLPEEQGICILELKYESHDDADLDFISQYLPFRRTRNSKYVNGVLMCYER